MIFRDLDFDAYLARDAVSKSQLWELHSKSPAHAQISKEPSNAMAMGVAVHCAVLEPETFEDRFRRGPDDRRGNKWKEAVEQYGSGLLTSGDYDDALAVRDALMHEPMIRRLAGADTWREASAFEKCPLTGLMLRCRPDAWAPEDALMADLKSTTDARPDAFARRVEQFGYHAQEAHYTDTWPHEVQAFVFIAVEPRPPYAYAVYELEPSAVTEGRAIIDAAKRRWDECQRKGVWPGYPSTVQPLNLRRFAYKLTEPQQGEYA